MEQGGKVQLVEHDEDDQNVQLEHQPRVKGRELKGLGQGEN